MNTRIVRVELVHVYNVVVAAESDIEAQSIADTILTAEGKLDVELIHAYVQKSEVLTPVTWNDVLSHGGNIDPLRKPVQSIMDRDLKAFDD